MPHMCGDGVLVVWTPEDKVMNPDHGRRFAQLLPHARLVELCDSWTLIPQDQPVALAEQLRTFIAGTATPGERPGSP